MLVISLLIPSVISLFSGNIQIEFGRADRSSCPALSGGIGPDLLPWQQAEIVAGDQITRFRAEIGQAGGERGYEGITGMMS